MTIVIDASFAVEFVSSDLGRRADQRIVDLAGVGLLAPIIFWYETASGLRSMVLRGAISPGFRSVALARLRGFDIGLDDLSPDLGAVIRASEIYQLTVYDAAYLELAVRTGSDLLTSDKGLIQAAPRAGVRLAIAP